MDTNDTLTSRSFTVSQLFSGKLKIAIPDMQRDFCWGADKVRTFVSGIAYLYKQRRPATLGLIYAFEQPAGSQCLHVVDGQQRLTTMYLLLGVLYQRTQLPWLRRMLMADYSLVSDQEPRLLYQSRRQAMYFLTDLTLRYFSEPEAADGDIREQDWYYRSYDSDPSVRAFVDAIASINAAIDKAKATSDGWPDDDFAQFVANSIQFICCTLPSRQKAEDYFITINTTGEPLTRPQSLRSLCIAAKADDAAARWDEMEQWAWLHRADGTADAAIERVMSLFATAHRARYGREVDDASIVKHFDELYQFFKSYARLVELWPDAAKASPFVAVGSAAYAKQHTSATPIDTARWAAMMSNIERYQRPGIADVAAAMATAEMMTEPDVLSLLRLKDAPGRIVNEEERAKLQLIKRNIDKRPHVEELLRIAQAHPMLCGRVLRVMQWSTPKGGDTPNLMRLAQYVEAIYRIWGSDIHRREDLDRVRVALLTLRHRDFPIVRRGDIVLSLCWNDYDWQRLMTQWPGMVRQLIDRTESITLDDMAARFADRSYPYHFIIKNPGLLRSCRKRQLLRPCDPMIGITYIDERGDTHTRWWLEQTEIKCRHGHWSPLRTYGAKCLYVDNLDYNVAIDLYYTPGGKSKYRIEVFSRPDSPREPYDVKRLVSVLGNAFALDKKRGRYYALLRDAHAAVAAFNSLIKAF